MKEYASDQSRIWKPKISYSGHQISVTDVSYGGWRLVTLIFKYLTPDTVAGRQPLYETQILYISYGTSVTVRDFSHWTRFRTLYPWQRWEFIKENKKTRTRSRKRPRKKEKTFFFSWSLSWSSSRFLTFLFSFKNFHLWSLAYSFINCMQPWPSRARVWERYKWKRCICLYTRVWKRNYAYSRQV